METYFNNINNLEEIKNTIKTNDKNKIIIYIKNHLKFNELGNFFNELFINYSGKSFKYDNLYNIYNELFLTFFLQTNNNYNYNNILLNFISSLIKINKAQNILYKLPFDLKYELGSININKLFINATRYSTLPVVIYFLKICDSQVQDIHMFTILKNVLYNSDDRVYKYIIKKLKYSNALISNSHSLGFIASIFSNNNTDKSADKYKLRKIKFLSQYIDINKYIKNIIPHITNYDLLYNLLKYNFTGFTFNGSDYYETEIFIKMFNYILKLCNDNDYNKIKNNITKIYNLLQTDSGKNLFYIIFSILLNNSFGYKFIKDNINYGGFIYNCYKYVNYKIDNRYFIKDIDKTSYYQFIDKVISMNGVDVNIFTIYKYVDIWSNNIKYNNKKIFIKLNISFYYLNRYINKKTKFYSLQNNIRIIKNNWNNSIINNNDNIKNKITFIPPYHLLPNQLNILKSTMIREKADGELCFELPKNIEPTINISYKIKAEYIEDLDLYLIFDIDINKNIKERYSYLRSLHPDVKNTSLDSIYDWDNLINCINIERENVIKFLNKPYKSYRWYPKGAWEISNFDNNIINKLNSIISNESLSDTIKTNWLCNNGPYTNDGFILTPMNGKREIKIKPKNLLTLDLLYKDDNWVDRDDYNYNYLIKKGKFKNDTIYRCYPVDNIYEAREIRYDKTKANPRNIINNLISLYNCNYFSSYDKLYYTNNNFKYSDEWDTIFANNNSIIKNFVSSLKNNNILDLGCGNAKIIKIINKYESYYGIDYDMSNIIKASYKYNSQKNIFNYINLSKIWNETENRLYDFDNKIFDTVYAINSLMHFCTDDFWEQLNKYTVRNTVFIFNLVNDKLDKYTFGEKSYIERDNNHVNYFFEHVHSKPISEQFISNEKLYYYLKKYNWKNIEKYTPITNLNKYYTWYKVIHI